MLTELQNNILKILKISRTEESHFAGGSTLNYMAPRMSGDFDIFHDSQAVLRDSALTDIYNLRQNGFNVFVDESRLPNMLMADIIFENQKTSIQWCFDSLFRFFPAIEDDIFGYRLSDEDLCINKVLTFGSRGETRDYIDVCQMLKDGKPVLAFVFAACEVDPGYVPQTLINAMDFNIRKAYIDWDEVKGNSFSKQQARMLFQDFKQFYHENINNVSLTDGFGLFLDSDTGKAFWPTKEDIASGRYVLHHGKNYGSIPQLRTDASPAP